MSAGGTRVLLWDIDGTLLTTKRAGVFALEEAAREVCGTTPDFAELQTAGLTDHEIALVAIEVCGGDPSPETAAAFLRVYERYLPDRLGWRDGSALPGVVAILEDLSDDDGILSLLLTGNTPAGARAKLEHFGIAGFLSAGAFCESGNDRETIADRALELASEMLGGRPDPDSTFVIGDTPHDIRCGKHIGARTIAVATGVYTAAELREHEPWRLLDELPPPAQFRELVTSGANCG